MEKSGARLVSSAILILAGVAGAIAGSFTPAVSYMSIGGMRPIALLGVVLVAGGALVYIAALIESRRS